MNKLLLIILCLGASSLHAQNNISYISQIYNNLTCAIIINEEDTLYSMQFTEMLSSDLGSTVHYSFGTFKRDKDCIKFHDTLNGLRMVAKVSNNGENLRFISAIDFMLNGEFKKSGYASRIINDEIPRMYMNHATDIGTGPEKNILKYGRYIDEEYFLSLYIEKDSSFLYYLMGVAILKGTWSQNGNLIILHDEHTNHDFYLIYEYPNLRTMLLPGDWNTDGTILKRQ